MRAIQGHSGGNQVDLSLQDNMEIPYDWTDYIHHAGPSHDCNSINRSGRIAGGNDSKEGPHTAVDPMNEPLEDEPYDVTTPRKVQYNT